MPRNPIDYQKVIIYKLVCNDLTIKDLYVGHTTNFINRKKIIKIVAYYQIIQNIILKSIKL